ncbi:hypothetical protein A5621_19375 [Mycobacterium colombiense]|uniref:hypothetical protein n=1 Tax=Mycobacterium colombiense TaxID=339268 RepID=UPI0007EF5D93|nr:hypothetical protein [Mycobacterium colombiense]OBJ34106.1 hypothetical protein A5621_19375 [Mycobacterium colombiense]OBK64774.1 hypothetical protein A5653_22220 [Mycobacterium colombiense]
MAFRGVGVTRRWQLAIAVTAALGVFIALVTGTWLRPNFAATAPLEPAAWSAAPVGAQAGQTHERPVVGRAALAAERPSAPANKTNQKPFRSAWMTKERPLTWNRLSPQSVLTPAPLSFTPIGFAPAGTQARAPAAVAYDRDILTRICVARR